MFCDMRILAASTRRQDMTNPKNKRLSQTNRDALIRFAYKRIDETATAPELDAAYTSAANAIGAAIVAKYPKKDMEVLKRYSVAQQDLCVYFSGAGAQYGQFEYRKDDTSAPFTPRSRYCNERTPYILDEAGTEAVVGYLAMLEKRNADKKQRYNDFRSLITTVASFNELAAVWPACEELRERIVGAGTSLLVMNDDVMARIKADPAVSA